MATETCNIGSFYCESYVTSGTNNNYLVFRPIPTAKQSSSIIDGIYTFNGINATEIMDADLDVELTGSNYAFSVGVDNKIKLAFDKALHVSKSAALTTLKYIDVVYELGKLKLDTNNYTLIARDGNGQEIHKTTPVSLEQANSIISTLVLTKDFDSEGTISFKISPNFINT